MSEELQTTEATLTTEDRARAQGWKPQEDYPGDPEKWVDAETFIQRGQEHFGIARERLKTLEEQVSRQNKKLSVLEQANSSFAAYHQTTIENLQKTHEQQVSVLKKQQRQAASDGDLDRFDDLAGEIKDLEASKPIVAPMPTLSQEHELAKALQEWVDDGNEWFIEQPKLAKEAFDIAERLRIARPKLVGRAQMDEVARIIRKNYPDLTNGGTSGRRSTAVQTGDTERPSARGSKKTFADLPEDAKTQCKDFVRDIKGFTKEQYVKDYFGE